MKSQIIFAVAFFVSTLTFGQEIPKKEFRSTLSENALAISPGETREVKVSILRSKAWKKSAANVSIPAALPEGITITFAPREGLISESTMQVKVDEDVQPGVYTILVRTEIRHTKKGNLLRLEIGTLSKL